MDGIDYRSINEQDYHIPNEYTQRRRSGPRTRQCGMFSILAIMLLLFKIKAIQVKEIRMNNNDQDVKNIKTITRQSK